MNARANEISWRYPADSLPTSVTYPSGSAAMNSCAPIEAELRRIEDAVREAAGPRAADLVAAKTGPAVGAGLLAG